MLSAGVNVELLEISYPSDGREIIPSQLNQKIFFSVTPITLKVNLQICSYKNQGSCPLKKM